MALNGKFPQLSDNQINGLAEIMADAGQVFLASLVIPFFISLDHYNSGMLLSGLVLMIGSWIFSLYLRKV